MKVTFKRDGHVCLGKYKIGYVWKPDPKRRFSMGKRGHWNFQFSTDVKVGQGLKLLRELGFEYAYTDLKLNDLKATLRKEFTASKMKKVAAHCDTIEKRRAAIPPPTKEEQEELERTQKFLDGMLGQ